MEAFIPLIFATKAPRHLNISAILLPLITGHIRTDKFKFLPIYSGL